MIHNEECGPFVRGISVVLTPTVIAPSYHNLHNAHVAFWAALGIYGVTFRMCRTGGLLELAIQVIKKNDGILSEAVCSELQAFTLYTKVSRWRARCAAWLRHNGAHCLRLGVG